MNAKLSMVLRLLLGLALAVFGANKFFGFMGNMELPTDAGNLMTAMFESGYMLQLIGTIEVVVGLLLLTKKWVPFALLILAPVSLNMILFHLFLAPAAIGPAAVIGLITLLLFYDNWGSYKGLFK